MTTLSVIVNSFYHSWTTRRLLVMCVALLLLACAFNSLSDVTRPDGTVLTSLIKVLAFPEKYFGKRVHMYGYLKQDKESLAVYVTHEHAKALDFQSAVWLDGTGSKVKFSGIGNGSVMIVGTIYCSTNGVGHFGVFPIGMSNIVSVRRVH